MKIKKTRRRNKKRWLEKYESLKYFLYEFGNIPVCRKKHCGLAEWVNNQRRAYRNEQQIQEGIEPNSGHRILEEHIKLLDNINFIWNTRKMGRRLVDCDEIEFEFEKN